MANIHISDVLRLIISIGICQCAGFIGSLFTSPAVPTWYATLKKPLFTPPSWIFAPVWITLYLLMGISLFLVWRVGLSERTVKVAIGVFLVQLILNTSWSISFFGFRSPVAGLVVIILLWIFIILTIQSFLKVSVPAGLMLIPYVLWVSFAAILNTSIVLLNR